ncbi:MAG TPA: hypothetical protein DC000_02860 [Clostridiales bacterium]|nr:hypothetical protein [Clostridiales bacterium]
MKTVFSEFLQEKDAEKREYILKSADYYIKDFKQLLQYIK